MRYIAGAVCFNSTPSKILKKKFMTQRKGDEEIKKGEDNDSVLASTLLSVVGKLTAAVSESFERVEKFKRRRSISAGNHDDLATEKRRRQ